MKQLHDNILTVRATQEQMRRFKEGAGTKYDMSFWGAQAVGPNLWEVAFESPVEFGKGCAIHLRQVAAQLRVA